MIDRSRCFTVSVVNMRHVRLIADDAKTLAWAERNGQLVSNLVQTLHDGIMGRECRPDALPWQPLHEPNVETPSSIRRRFVAMLEASFPTESFHVHVA